jgi:hypothetical protein
LLAEIASQFLLRQYFRNADLRSAVARFNLKADVSTGFLSSIGRRLSNNGKYPKSCLEATSFKMAL